MQVMVGLVVSLASEQDGRTRVPPVGAYQLPKPVGQTVGGPAPEPSGSRAERLTGDRHQAHIAQRPLDQLDVP